MNNEKDYMNIPAEKFKIVERNETIHDLKLDTKPIGYFKDAMIRFRKNKGSVVAACIIAILFLFAIIVPFVSNYSVAFKDAYYSTVLPKFSTKMDKNGFWDGTRTEDLNQLGFDYYNSIGQESGRNAIVKIKETYVGKGGTHYVVQMDSYYRLGYKYMNLTESQYLALQQYQNETGIQVMYPVAKKSEMISSTDSNWWFKTDEKGNAVYDANGDYINIYKTDGEDYYESLRIAGDDGSYKYATVNQTGYQVRVCYYDYFVYLNGFEPVFVFGTNAYGQDLFVCLAVGARLSFLLAVSVSFINLAIGAIYGAIEGYYGGATDLMMERIADVLNGVPFIVVVTLFQLYCAKQAGPVLSLLFAFVLTGWLGTASRVRMQFYRFKGQEYVLAARTLGASDGRLIVRHIFPNSLGTIITGSVLVVPSVIFSESTLTYLGIVNLEASSITSIGTLLAGGEAYLSTFPHIIIFPAMFISLLMISFNMFGNGLRDAFNPSLRGADE